MGKLQEPGIDVPTMLTQWAARSAVASVSVKLPNSPMAQIVCSHSRVLYKNINEKDIDKLMAVTPTMRIINNYGHPEVTEFVVTTKDKNATMGTMDLTRIMASYNDAITGMSVWEAFNKNAKMYKIFGNNGIKTNGIKMNDYVDMMTNTCKGYPATGGYGKFYDIAYGYEAPFATNKSVFGNKTKKGKFSRVGDIPVTGLGATATTQVPILLPKTVTDC